MRVIAQNLPPETTTVEKVIFSLSRVFWFTVYVYIYAYVL